jgi:hypothetical protein
MRAAAGAIGEVLAGQRLPEALQRHMAALPPASRAPARDMAYQALRNKARVTALTSLLNGRAPDRMVLALQWIALAQLLEPMRAQAIVVDQAVAAARAAFPAAAGFLNATLRRFLREQAALLTAIEADPVVRYEHPKWWLDELAQAYGKGATGRGMANGGSKALKELEKEQKTRATRMVRDSLDAALLDIATLYRDIMLVQSGHIDALINLEMAQEINMIASVLPTHKTIQRLDAVMKARKALGFNAAPLLTIEALMCELV